MVNWATHKPYSFLYINKTVPMKDRYRRNLSEIIDLKLFRTATRKPNAQAYESQLDDLLTDDEEDDNVGKECDGGAKRAHKKIAGCGKRRNGNARRRQLCDVYGGPPNKKTKKDYEEQIAESI